MTVKSKARMHTRSDGQQVALARDCEISKSRDYRTEFAEFDLEMACRCGTLRVYQPREFRFRCPRCDPFVR